MISDNIFMIVKTVLDYVNVFFVIYLIGYSSFLFLAVVVGSSELYSKLLRAHQYYRSCI